VVASVTGTEKTKVSVTGVGLVKRIMINKLSDAGRLGVEGDSVPRGWSILYRIGKLVEVDKGQTKTWRYTEYSKKHLF